MTKEKKMGEKNEEKKKSREKRNRTDNGKE